MAFDMNNSKYSGCKDFEWAVKLNRLSLRLIGLWPKPAQNRREKLICNLRTSVAFVTLTVCVIIPSVHFLIKICSDIILIVDNLIFILPIVTCWLRILIFWWKKEAIGPIMMMIMEDWLKSRNMQEVNVMIKWAQGARIIVICTYCIMGMGYLLTVFLPLFGISLYLTNITNISRPLPVQGYYIYDITKKLQYQMTFISQIISMFFGITAYTGIDNFLGLLVFHICGQLDILKNRLTHLHKLNNFYGSLRSSVMDHKRLLRAIIIVEDTYNIILLALFVYFALLFAFCGFLIMNLLEEENDLSIIRLSFLILVIINSSIHMFLYCAVGELLVTHCDGIYYAVCNQEWYSLHPRDARNLIFLMIRSSKPIYLTAGKVFLMTIPTFCSLIKTSAGYMSVLLTTRS